MPNAYMHVLSQKEYVEEMILSCNLSIPLDIYIYDLYQILNNGHPPESFFKLAFTLSVIDQLLPLRPLDWSSLAC